MKTRNALMICLGLALAQPVLAQDATKEELGDLRPQSEMEAPPIALGEDMLVESTSTVEAIDRANRLVTLKDADGGMVTVKAGDEVRNFDQISKGDKVTVSYYRSAALDIIEPGSKPKIKVDSAMERAKPGEKPGAVMVTQVRKTVKIISVDPYKKAISFRDESGWREVSMNRPELEPYLKELKDGDTVEVIFTEAMAISMTKH